MQSKVKQIRDEESSVVLRPVGSAAYATASTQNNTGVPLNTLNTARWDNKDIPWHTIGAQIVVEAIDFADDDGTYTLQLEVGDDESFSNSVIAAQIVVTSAGPYQMLVDPDTVKQMQATSLYIRLNAVVTETTPSITYHGWLFTLPLQ